MVERKAKRAGRYPGAEACKHAAVQSRTDVAS
jgi:hypothetical protein